MWLFFFPMDLPLLKIFFVKTNPTLTGKAILTAYYFTYFPPESTLYPSGVLSLLYIDPSGREFSLCI